MLESYIGNSNDISTLVQDVVNLLLKYVLTEGESWREMLKTIPSKWWFEYSQQLWFLVKFHTVVWGSAIYLCEDSWTSKVACDLFNGRYSVMVPFSIVVFLCIQAFLDLAIGFWGIDKWKDTISRFTNLTDDFQVLETFQLSFHMRSHCYQAFLLSLYDGFGIRLKSNVIFTLEALDSFEVVW